MRRGGRVFAAVLGASLARGFLVQLTTRPPGGTATWAQKNYAGRTVTRLGGPAYALGVVTALPLVGGSARTRMATALAAGAAASVGAYDDVAGDDTARGLVGHGSRLAAGQVTTGTVKVAGLAAGGLAAGILLHRKKRDAFVAGALIAGCANLANLLDLRPGRAIKAGLLGGLGATRGPAGPAVATGLGAAAALLPEDLAERIMLGDSGAGALGAVVGVGLASNATPAALRRRLAVVSALTVASEFVSFSDVIDSVPLLRGVDRLGRRR